MVESGLSAMISVAELSGQRAVAVYRVAGVADPQAAVAEFRVAVVEDHVETTEGWGRVVVVWVRKATGGREEYSAEAVWGPDPAEESELSEVAAKKKWRMARPSLQPLQLLR